MKKVQTNFLSAPHRSYKLYNLAISCKKIYYNFLSYINVTGYIGILLKIDHIITRKLNTYRRLNALNSIIKIRDYFNTYLYRTKNGKTNLKLYTSVCMYVYVRLDKQNSKHL